MAEINLDTPRSVVSFVMDVLSCPHIEECEACKAFLHRLAEAVRKHAPDAEPSH